MDSRFRLPGCTTRPGWSHNTGVSSNSSFNYRRSALTQRLEQVSLHDLDPVTIWIFDKGHVAHLALFGALHVHHLVFIKPAHGSSQIRHGEADMAKALGLRITIVIFEICITFGTPVVSQLKNTGLAEGPGGTLARILWNI